ncbi:serine/threonine-protein kinase SMG1-like [Pieris brassicae]|uniref:serine/threonine-protein kinase SMG1-like n=1 Tax=Pieris brassicae TaxID=7116 RepID=UPI001E661F8D|nr:serine/threonine-protein kinase SMG1-like [Pieris brassicae]
MRRGRETLLTLLEAFVYDPLVEWGGGRRRRGTRHVRAARAMLAVRQTPIDGDICHLLFVHFYSDRLVALLPEVQQCADKWLEENDKLNAIETKLQECHQQMALIKEIESYGNHLSGHPLYAISQKYTSYKQAKNAVEDSMKVLVKILNDFDTQIENFVTTNEVLNGPQLMAWVQEFSGSNEDDERPIFDHIQEFLTNAGQGSMLTQCEQAETELNQSMQQTNILIRSCLELLSQYVAVSQYYPQSQTEYHRIATFRKFLAAALESKSPEVCRDVANQVTAMVNAENTCGDSQQIIAFNYRLQQLNAEANVHLNKCLERLQVEGGPDAIVIAQEAYKEAKNNISNWVRTEEGAAGILESVVIGMLCNLNRRYLMLENGAQSAGDCLVDLTSREGEWFLDDMSALSMQAVELLSLLPLQSAAVEDAAMPVAVECVRNANLLLADLVQLNYNFSTIILPEALKKVHSEDSSALHVITELNAVIMNSQVPLNEILAQLELHFRYLLMDMESPAPGAQLLAAELRARYEALLSTTAEEGQSGGRMLLMGFNGLFAAVELRGRELADHLDSPVPPAWRKIDHVDDALRMSAAMQRGTLRAVLEDMFLVRRVQTVAEVFAMCVQVARAARGGPVAGPSPPPYDDAALAKPVGRYVAEYVSRCVLGVPSRALASVLCLLLRRARLDIGAEVEQKEIGASWSVSLESLCEKVCRAGSERGASLAGGVVAARARLSRAAAAVRVADRARAAARALRLRTAAHAHLHAEVLNGSQESSAALARRSRELSVAEERLASAAGRARSLVQSAHQRVKWGAGANPALRGVVRGLESAWGFREERARRLSSAASALARHARAAAALGAPPAARAQRTQRAARTLRTALAHWEKACALTQKYSLAVTPLEESLMEMLHPEGNIDAHWVETVSALVREMTQSVGGDATRARAQEAAASQALRRAADAVASPAAVRAALLPDLLAPLAALAEVSSLSRDERLAFVSRFSIRTSFQSESPAAEFLERWRAATERLNAIAAEAVSRRQVETASRSARTLRDDLPALLDALAELPANLSESGAGRPGRRPASAAARPHGRHAGERRNSVGAGVWRRVRLKLEGRDSPASQAARRATPAEQVDYIIAEATSVENLCLMYEGWMAWV